MRERKKRGLSRSLSWMLTVMMVLSLFSGLALPAFAEEPAPEPDGAVSILAVPDSISVAPSDASIVLGANRKFEATVVGEGAEQAVVWSVSGNTDAATTIDATGLLTVSGVEGAKTLKVVAASAADDSVFGSAEVTITDLPFSLNLSRNDLLLHYIFDTNDKGPTNDYVKDYSPQGNHSTINGAPTAAQWSANGFTFNNNGTPNSNYITIPTSANLVNPQMTIVFGLTRTGTQTGSGSLFSGKSGWASNGFWMNTNNCYISHNGGTGATLGAYATVFPQNSRVEFGYATDARTSSATGTIMLNGVKSAIAVNPAQITRATPLDWYSIGLNTWGDEPLRNARLDKYMIFNRTLTEAELLEVYQGRLDPYKAALNDAVVSALGRNEAYYTVASMATMRSARRAAVNVLKNRIATADEVSAALSKLQLTVRDLTTVDNIINSVTLTPKTASMNLATTRQFTVDVQTGSGSIPKTVEWSVNSEISTITQDGLLTVPLTETAKQLTVTVTSTIDYAKSDTATVTVTEDDAVVSIAVSPKTAEVMKGDSATFTANLATVGAASKAVNWSVDSTDSQINSSGVLSVGVAEAKSALTVTATSAFDSSKSDTATVNTYAITGVTIIPPAETPQKGRSSLFAATVNGAGVPDTARSVTWEVIGATSGETEINAFGSLSVGTDETATQLTIKATSVKDPTKSATRVVAVDEYKEEALLPANGYYNTMRRAPGTGTAYGNNAALPEWDSNGTWRTVTGQTASPVMSTNTGLNWSIAQSNAGGLYTAGEGIYLGDWTTYFRCSAPGTAPGGDIATYNGGKYADIDYTIGMRLNTGANSGAVVFRYQDVQNYYYVRMTVGSGITIGKVVKGVDTVLRTATTTVSANTWYNLRVTVKGNNITVRRHGFAYWRIGDSTQPTTVFNNVQLDAAESFKQGRCGVWAPGGSANALFNLVGIGSLDFNYTISNSTFTLTSGSYGHLKSLKVNNGALTNMDFMSNEDQIRVEMGPNKYLGELKFRYQVEGGSVSTANTGSSADIRDMRVDEADKKILVDYSSKPSANTNGIRDFAVQEAYSVGTDTESGDYVKFDIHIKNTSSKNIEFQDIALPISWNVHWQADSPYVNYAAHASNYVSYNSSYIELERASGGGDKIIFIPDSSTDAKLEYRRYASTQDYYMNMPEEFYIYSKGIAAQTANNYNQSYLPNTSLTLAAGEEKTFSFKIFKTSDYLGINDILSQQGLIAPSVNPGMVAPINNIAEVDLRTIKNIESVADLTPNPPAPAVAISAERRATITKNVAKSSGEHNVYNIKFNKLGRNDITVTYDGGKKTVLQFWVTEDLQDAIQRRASFLVDELWLSDERRASIMAANASTTQLYQFVDKHPYSFLEMNNVTGVAGLHSGNSFYCSNSDYEQYYDGPDFLAAKNVYYPVQREVDALDKYLVDHVWKDQIYHFGDTNEGYMYTGCCQQVGFGSSVWTRINRVFNYPRIYNQFWSMYQIATRYPGITMKEDALWYLRVAGIVARRGISLSGSTGVMGEQTIADITAALQAEGETTLANQLQTPSVTKGTNMAAQAYPFGSEFSVDNTAEEGAYFNIKNFSTAANRIAKMKQTVDKCMAWIGKTPLWYLQTTGRPMGNDWWMFQYAVGLQAKAYQDWYFNYADENTADYNGNGQYSQDIWRMVYPAKMSPFVHILSGQPEFNIGPASGGLANTDQAISGRGVKGSVWGNIMPTRPYNWNLGFPYSTSAESDISLWSGLQILSADIVPKDPSFGLVGYGGVVTDGGKTYEMIPQDGLYRRLNVVGDRFQMELIHDRYTAASINKDYKAISLEVENATKTAHTGTVSLRGLKAGQYNIRVDGQLQGTATVTDSNAKTNVSYSLANGSDATLRVVDVNDDDTTTGDRIINVTVAPQTANALKGGSVAFTPSVNMVNEGGLLAGTVSWSVSNGTSSDTKIADGVLTVGADETATTLTVKATSTDDTTKAGTATVTVYSITNVVVTSPNTEVKKGKTLQLTATVSHQNAPAALRGVLWSVEGAGNLETFVSNTGLLTVAASETASQLTVKATSAGDAAKFATITINLVGRTPVTKADLRLQYIFDGKGTSGALKDYSKYGNDTTITGTINDSSWTTDGFAFASGNHIKLASSVQLVHPEMTIVFKIKRTGAMTTHSLFWGKNGSDWAGDGLWINTAEGMTIYHDGTATAVGLGTTADALFPLNTWTEVAYSIDTTASPAVGVLTVNGVKRNLTIPAETTVTRPSAAYNTIGMAGYDNEPLTNATMGKYMIFDRALTESELTAVYNGAFDPILVPADVTALKIVVDQYVANFPKADYTPSSWVPFEKALDDAKAIIAKPEDYTDDDVYAAMDALVAAESGLVRVVNKSGLKIAIDYATDMLKPANAGKYIPASVENLEDVLSGAGIVYADADATQAKVDKANADLLKAIGQMYEKGNKASLQALVTLVSRYVETNYTPASWGTFSKALEDARKVIANPNAIADSVNAAYTALSNATTGLTRKADFAALNASIALAQRIVDNIDDYVPSTVVGLAEELVGVAKLVAGNLNSTQAEVNAVTAALNARILAARLKPDLSGLLSATTKAKALEESRYTAASYKTLTTAVTEAEAVLRAPDKATQADVDGATLSVDNAIAALVPKAGIAGNDGKNAVADGKTVIPKVKISKLTTSNKAKIVVKWAKAPAEAKITGYQVQYRVKGTSKWTIKTVSAKSTSLTIKSLKKNKKYQIRVRAYRSVSSTKQYGAWSAVKVSKSVKK